jgi:hypothetical protein
MDIMYIRLNIHNASGDIREKEENKDSQLIFSKKITQYI